MRYVILLCVLVCLGSRVDALEQTVTAEEIQSMIRSGDIEAVSRLIQKQIDFVKIQESSANQSTTILDLAVFFGQHQILKLMLNHQSELGARFGSGALVTACASNKQNRELIEILLGAGVDINSRNHAGKTCLYRAALAADAEFFDYLMSLGADPAIEITPDKVLGIEGPLSIQDFVFERQKRYAAMVARISKAN